MLRLQGVPPQKVKKSPSDFLSSFSLFSSCPLVFGREDSFLNA